MAVVLMACGSFKVSSDLTLMSEPNAEYTGGLFVLPATSGMSNMGLERCWLLFTLLLALFRFIFRLRCKLQFSPDKPPAVSRVVVSAPVMVPMYLPD